MWRVRTNQELQAMYKDLDIVGDIKNKREWVWCIVRMDHGEQLRVNPGGKEDGKTKIEVVGKIVVR